MKINFIIDENNNDSVTDANIMNFMFKKIKQTTDIKFVNTNNFKCEKVSINIFFGVINNLLLDYAKYNILIPSQNIFKKEWLQFLDLFDKVIAKTRYIETIYKSFIPSEKLKYIGWRSTDISNNIDKDYHECLLFCYDSTKTNYKKIIENWEVDFPKLNIVNGHLFKLDQIETVHKQENIIIHSSIKQNELENLFNRCGIHLCLNEIDSFSHNINQSCLSKSIPVLVDNGSMKENVNSDVAFIVGSQKKKSAIFLGSRYEFNVESFKKKIKEITKTSLTTLEIMGKNARINAIKNHGLNDILFKEEFSNIIKNVRELPINKYKTIEEENLPKVSIVTLSHNRKHMFKLAIYNFNTINYPKDKIEWVIYDTSNKEDRVEDLLPNEVKRSELNINYIYDNTNLKSIGETRNNSITHCSNDIVVFMDDDDYYPQDSVLNRVSHLIHYNKKMVGCTIVGCFNINKFISYIYSEPVLSQYHRRISPATLCFYKNIINDTCRFNDDNIFECETIFKNMNYNDFKEISWENIIISISHKNNTTNRNTPNSKANGCHYGWGEKLFKFIAELDD